ncbi:MAG: hypothetical protein ABSH06_06515 [Thermodesulfobacteriota bacterium]
MKTHGKLWIMFSIITCIFLAQISFATIYKYTDKKGTVCITDNETTIPEEYRDKVVVIKEKEEDIPSSEAIDKSQPVRQKTEVEAFEARSLYSRWQEMPLLKRLVISAFIFMGFLIIWRVFSRFLSDRRRQTLSWVRLGLGSLLLLYLVVAHGKDVTTAFGMLSDKISGFQANSEEKGRRAAEAAKRLKNLLDGNPDEVEKEPGK